jgi:hypothetical protein
MQAVCAVSLRAKLLVLASRISPALMQVAAVPEAVEILFQSQR